jgi:hypothetical protein
MILTLLRHRHRNIRRWQPQIADAQKGSPVNLFLFVWHGTVSGPATADLIMPPVWTGPGRVGAVLV